MQFANAIKKLEKLGFTVTPPVDPTYPRYTAQLGGKFKEIHFYVSDKPSEKPQLGECFVGSRGGTLNFRMSFAKAIAAVQARQ
jgi:hypothetical protein